MRRLVVLLLVIAVAIALLPTLLASMGLGPASLPGPTRLVELVPGRSLNVVESGAPARVPWVLVHGLPGSAFEWQPLQRALSARGRRVVSYDRVGFGYSSRGGDESDEHTYTAAARDLSGLLAELGAAQYVVVGWSYGGAVAQTLAAMEPARVARLVLLGSIGPSFPVDEPIPMAGVIDRPGGPALMRWIGGIPPLARGLARSDLAVSFSGAEHIPPGYLEAALAHLGLPGTFEAFVAEWERNDPTSLQPEGIAVPTLVVHSTDDRTIDYEVARDLDARLPNSRLETLFEASHMFPITHAEQLAEILDLYVGPL